jgi:hypothetical protein
MLRCQTLIVLNSQIKSCPPSAPDSGLTHDNAEAERWHELPFADGLAEEHAVRAQERAVWAEEHAVWFDMRRTPT